LRIERKTEIARKLRERKGGSERSARQIQKEREETERDAHKLSDKDKSGYLERNRERETSGETRTDRDCEAETQKDRGVDG